MAPSSTLQARDSGSTGISVNAIVGIAIGGTVFIIAVLTIIVAVRSRRRRKRKLPRHSVNLSNTELFFTTSSKNPAIVRERKDTDSSRPDSEAPLLGHKTYPSTLRVELSQGKEAHVQGGHSPVYSLSNPYDEFGRSQSRLPEFLPVSNTPPPPRLLDSPHVGINFIAATPSPAPTYMLAKPNSVPSTASTTPRGGISALPPIIVPQYTSPPSMDSSDPTGPIMFSARMDDSDADSASLYSLPSAPSSHPPSRSATSLLPIPPVPPIPAQYQSNPAANSSSSTIRPPLEKREIDFRDVGLPNPHFPAPATSPEDDEMQLDRSNTAFIGSLLQQRAERVEASSESGAGLERSMSQVSHIERAGSIRAAGEAGYGTRLAKVRETRGSEDALLVEGTGTRSTKASVHSKWAAEGALKAVSEKDGSKVEVSLSKDIPDGTLTGAFTPSAVSPEHTPPSDYPYMAGQDLFHAHTAPLNIRKP